jgi:hypothetical protein
MHDEDNLAHIYPDNAQLFADCVFGSFIEPYTVRGFQAPRVELLQSIFVGLLKTRDLMFIKGFLNLGEWAVIGKMKGWHGAKSEDGKGQLKTAFHRPNYPISPILDKVACGWDDGEEGLPSTESVKQPDP